MFVIDYVVDCVMSTVNYVDYTIREPGFLKQVD